MSRRPTIGLDLGSSFCCVATAEDGTLAVLPNVHGGKTTCSVVTFTEERSFVGENARDRSVYNPSNTVYGTKRIMGRNFGDNVVENFARFSTCSVVNDSGRPCLEVRHRKSTLRAFPELIAAMQILYIKQQAELAIGEVGGAVVSVPAYFGNSQREAIVSACQIAGLELLDLLSDPTATALAYRENRARPDPQTILVFDMGASKLDVSVIRVSGEEVRVLAVCGDAAYGGDDLDQHLMRFLDDKFFKSNGKRLLGNPKSKMRLQIACEKLKKNLTLLPSGRVHEDSILNDLDLDVLVKREEFEGLFGAEFSRKLSDILESALRDARVEKDQVEEVVVVGGCSRVPFIQSCLKKHFPGMPLNQTVNADESVAVGAALLAQSLSKGTTARDAGVIELIRDPSPTRRTFPKYMELKPNIKLEIETSKIFRNSKEERVKHTFALGPFGVFKSEVLYIKPFDKNKSKQKINWQVSLVSQMNDQLKTLEKHRKNVEAVEASVDDLEEYCYGLQKRLKSSDTQDWDGALRSYLEDVLEWVEGEEEGRSVSECEKRKRKLSEMWDAIEKKIENSKPCRDVEVGFEDEEMKEAAVPGENASRGMENLSKGVIEPRVDLQTNITPNDTLQETNNSSHTRVSSGKPCLSQIKDFEDISEVYGKMEIFMEHFEKESSELRIGMQRLEKDVSGIKILLEKGLAEIKRKVDVLSDKENLTRKNASVQTDIELNVQHREQPQSSLDGPLHPPSGAGRGNHTRNNAVVHKFQSNRKNKNNNNGVAISATSKVISKKNSQPGKQGEKSGKDPKEIAKSKGKPALKRGFELSSAAGPDVRQSSDSSGTENRVEKVDDGTGDSGGRSKITPVRSFLRCIGACVVKYFSLVVFFFPFINKIIPIGDAAENDKERKKKRKETGRQGVAPEFSDDESDIENTY